MDKQTVEREKMSEQASVITSEDAAALGTSTTQIAAALRKKPRIGESIIQTFLFLAGAISILTTIGIVYVLGTESINFFTQLSWEETNKELETAISATDTTIVVSPLKMVPDFESRDDLDFLSDGVYMEIHPDSTASAFEYVHIPVDIPSVLFGTPTKLKSVRVCYRCDQAASFVTTTIVGQGTDSGTVNNMINNTTNRTSTSWDCYTVTDTTPNVISGSVYVQLSLALAGTGSAHDIRIGNITLTLTEE